MSTQNQHITELFHKYMDRSYTEQELVELLEYFNLEKHDEQLLALIHQRLEQPAPKQVDTQAINKAIKQMDQYVLKRTRSEKSMRAFSIWATAIAAMLILALGFVFKFIGNREQFVPWVTIGAHDVAPATNRATITLSDGSKYELSDDQQGIKIGDTGIAYTDGSLITTTGKVTTAEINVPRGGIYNVTLQDGTKVSLNSGSTLRYPLSFAGVDRKVELEGEGYFEVSHNPKQPFIVTTGVQELKVLGTHFNIHAYTGEKIISTLLEGSVELHMGGRNIKLRPGYQSVVQNEKFAVNAVNPEEYTAWIDKQFVFNNMPLEEALAEIERWYDVKFEYPQNLMDQRVYAGISRDRKLSEVLKALEEIVNLKFTIEGRRVLVRK